MDLRRLRRDVKHPASLPDRLAAAGGEEEDGCFVIANSSRQGRDLLDGLRQASTHALLGSRGLSMKWPEHDCSNHPPCPTCVLYAKVEAVIVAAKRVTTLRQGSIIDLREAMDDLEG